MWIPPGKSSTQDTSSLLRGPFPCIMGGVFLISLVFHVLNGIIFKEYFRTFLFRKCLLLMIVSKANIDE